MRDIVVAMLVCVATSAQAENRHFKVGTEVCYATCENARLRIWDGDTFIIDQSGKSPVKIRIENIDAPEIAGRCPFETDLAQRSKIRLATLLSGRISIYPGPLDKYGRQLATVSSDNGDVGEILITEKLARRWDGARHPWCPST